MITHRPILFSGPMVRAILDGRKTMTRRVVKPQPTGDFAGYKTDLGYPASLGHVWAGWYLGGKSRSPSPGYFKCPYGQPGDRLWVREAVRLPDTLEYLAYKADLNTSRWNEAVNPAFCKWTPSIHMPRWASRLTLEITGVRVERLQEISEKDAIAEGSPPDHPSISIISRHLGYPDFPRSWFAQLWDMLNAKRGFPWESNPFVWVIEFKRITP